MKEIPPLDGFINLWRLLWFGLAGKNLFNKVKLLFNIKYEVIADTMISKQLLKEIGIKYNYSINYEYLKYNIF